jgi:hypothetical protein
MLEWYHDQYFPPELQITCSLLPPTVFFALTDLIAMLRGAVPFSAPPTVLAAAFAPALEALVRRAACGYSRWTLGMTNALPYRPRRQRGVHQRRPRRRRRRVRPPARAVRLVRVWATDRVWQRESMRV